MYIHPSSPNTPKPGSRFREHVLVFAIALASLLVILGVAAAASNHQSLSSYQRQLRSQVDTASGAPRSGRDPASQKQTTLSEVATKPAGSGQRVEKPAANVSGGKKRVNPAKVLPDTKKTGMLASGCLLDYGTPGEECLPARTNGNKPVTCKDVGLLFADGLTVTGKDRLGLDRNKDKTVSARDC